MQSLYHSSRINHKINLSHFAGFSLCGLLACLLFTPALYGNSPLGMASGASASATALAPVVPADPSDLAATAVSSSQINLTWTDNSSDETGFKIERKLSSAVTYTQIATVGPNVTSYPSTGLAVNTAYGYRIRAFNASGNSSYSNIASAKTLPNPPAAPSLLTATAVSSSQIDLSWQDNASNELGFIIERKTGVGGAYAVIDTVGDNATAYSSNGLTEGLQYFYKVRAYNAGGNSPYSNIANATTLINSPVAPSDLTASTVSHSQIDISWQDHADNEFGFIIERKIPQGGAGDYTAIDTVGQNVTDFSNTGLIGSKQYFYKVRAYGAGGNSAYSNEASATTLPDPPAAPSNLTATAVSTDQINLTWTDNAGDEDGFRIELKIGPSGTYEQLEVLGANVTSYSSTGLEASTQYFYRVLAFNADGNSSYSKEASATTLPDLPFAPTVLEGTAASNTQINLTWKDNSNDEDGFRIERRLSTTSSYTLIATVGANVTSYSSTGLADNTVYNHRVRAFNVSGNSSYSNTISTKTLPNSPAAPSNLTTTMVSNSQINLAWQDHAANELGFIIERKTGAADAYAPIDTVGANVLTFSNTGLTGSTQYFYKVRAYNLGGHSAYSNEASATTLIDPPKGPGNLMATTVNQTKIKLTWADSSNLETGFKIERKTGAAGTFAQIAAPGPNVTAFTDASLTPNTEYFYRVLAHNTTGNSPYSNEANATTLPTIPKAPGNLAATTVSQNQIDLAWADSSNNEDGFRIERKKGVAGAYTQIATLGPNVTSYSNIGLGANVTFFYRVRAYNIGGQSNFSDEASATTWPDPPTTPGNMTATAASSSQINVAWKDSSNNEAGFKIERKKGVTGVYAEVGTVGPNVTSFSNSGLPANTQFFYRVRAHNLGGHSSYSNEANTKTLPFPPATPTDLAATTVSNTQINLTWTDGSTNESGFKIERKTGVAGAYAEVGTVGPNVTSYSNKGLSGNTQYFYRVRASNAGGNSAYSNEVNATTLPNAPATPSLTATAVSQTQINLAWTDSSDNEDGFKIERKTGAGAYAQIAMVGPNVTSYSDNGLNTNTAYFYRVRGHNAGGHSAYSNEASATTLPNAPMAPDSLKAVRVNQTKINLSWKDNANNEVGFKIERKTGASSYAEIATVGPNVTSHSDSGLNANTKYFYRIRSHNTGGHSAYSNEANATTLPNPPAAPSSLTAATVSQTQINLSWMDNANNEVGFKIERKTGAGAYAQIAMVGANVTSYSDNGLSAETAYFYRVRGHNTGGHSAYSNEANATTLPDPPTAPDSLMAATVSSSQINLTWVDNVSNEDSFKIERKKGVAGAYAEVGSVGPNVTGFSSTGLQANNQYFYRVRAHNTGGQSSYSNEANAKTLPLPPAKPTNLVATPVSQTQINLTWTDASANETGFKIERKTGAAGTYAEVATVGANVTSYSNIGLTANTQYFYRVRASNTGGHSAYSNEVNATTLPNPPSAPSGLTALAMSNTQINLAWTDNAGNEAGFKIERKTGAAGTYAEVGSVGPNVTNYLDTGLNPVTQYFYRVRAHNTGGHSNYSNEANATTLPNPPAAPGNLTATTVSQTQIDLAWADSSNDENGFKIERKTVGGSYTEIATVGANVTNYSNTGLNANTGYFYRVRAHGTNGHSGYSNEANATTLPNAPSAPANLTATTVSQTQINLAWADNANNEAGFKIERKTGAAGTYAEIATVGANVTSYSSIGLNANTEYFYRVRAHNTGGHSAYSNESSSTTLPNPPAAPGNLTATPVSQTKINLAWADSANNETGFKIERKTGAAGTYAQIATVGMNVTSYADTTLAASTQYFYRVRANNTGGNSGYSNEANATTLPNPPTAPGNLTASAITNTQIDLAWADNSNNEAGFKIERKTGSGGTYAEIATVGANVTAYSNTGLTTSTEYFYRIRAHNAGGNSAYSNEANTITLSNDNLALNKPATASLTDSTSAASLAVDGSATTYWRSGFINAFNSLQWLQVELSPTTALTVGRAVVTWSQNYFAKEYEFQVSNDGSNWTTVYTNNAGAIGTQDFTFTTTTARFVRLYLKKHEKSNYRVLELEVYIGPAAKNADTEASAPAIPSTIALEPNYPNPFNPSTTLSYALPEGMHVTLKILNLAGQEVATLVNGYREAGIHRVKFNGAKLPSGVYMAVLQAGATKQVQRMTLAK